MCSIKVTLHQTHGQEQIFARSLKEAGDVSATARLNGLRALMGEVQMELNSALTQLVDLQRRMSTNKGQASPTAGNRGADEDDGSDEEDEDSEEDKANGSSESEPPEKIKKTF